MWIIFYSDGILVMYDYIVIVYQIVLGQPLRFIIGKDNN